MIKLTALWYNKTKDGKDYLSGYLGDAKINIFFNTSKQTEKSPDATIYLAEKVKKEDKKEEISESELPF